MAETATVAGCGGLFFEAMRQPSSTWPGPGREIDPVCRSVCPQVEHTRRTGLRGGSSFAGRIGSQTARVPGTPPRRVG